MQRVDGSSPQAGESSAKNTSATGRIIDNFHGNGNHEISLDLSSAKLNHFEYYDLLLKWLAHPLFVSKRRLSKISGLSMREINRLILHHGLRCYCVSGSKRVKYSLSDLLGAMQDCARKI
jgi:hypothetical protein